MHEDPSSDPAEATPYASSGATAQVAPIEYSTFPLRFTGDANEYFRIWIVNIFLTIITLGFYTPWARVRSRRYFHANTRLDGHSFDYLAKPINILWGYVIVLFFLAGYYVSGIFNPYFAIPFLALYVIAGPWLVYKAMRFKARNTSYRNVRFDFTGKVGEAYAIFLGMAFLVPLTLGLIMPYWIMKQKEYFYKNLRFGDKPFSFTPQAGEYYTRYIMAGVMGFAMSLLYGFVVAGVVAGMGAAGQSLEGDPPVWFFFAIYLSYIPFLIGFSFVQVYIFVSLFNYNLGQLLQGKTYFSSEVKIGKFYWITITNLLASVLSLGLLFPWAAVRKARYMMDCISVVHPGAELDGYTSQALEDVSALGDVAADSFDFDIGW